MYKIIGGDQKEYGPVTADELRRWIAEGRLGGQSLVRAEEEGRWLPLASFPEFAEALQEQPGGPSAGGPAGSTRPLAISSDEILARKPRVEISRCLSLSWKLLKSNFSLFFCATFLAWLGLFVQFVPLFGGIIYLLIYGILYGGLYMVFLNRIRGRPAVVTDVFAGFNLAFGQLMLVGFLTLLLTKIGMCLVVPGAYLLVAWTFSTPLVADKRLEFWSAMELSRKVVTHVWLQIFALLVMAFLPFVICYLISETIVSVRLFGAIRDTMASGQLDLKRMVETTAQVAKAGFLLVMLTNFILLLNLPFALGALMYAYEDLFGTRHSSAP